MKVIPTVMLLVISNTLWSQSITDALLLAQEDITGTSRYTGMAGAFGALGGDLSAIADNPAGAGVFNFSELGISSTITNNKTSATYFSRTTPQELSQFQIDQFGIVLTLNNFQPESDWTKIAFAFNLKKTADFGSKINALGTNPNQNLGDYFTYYADGLATENIEVFENETVTGIYEYLGNNFGYGAQQAFLGYQAYLINPSNENDGSNTFYNSNISQGAVSHDFSSEYSGSHQKYNFAFSAVYQNKLYLGAALNTHQINFEQRSLLRERSSDPDSPIQSASFENILNTFGTGFSTQIGLIFQFPKSFRLGLSYHSPQWLTLEEEGQQALSSEGLFESGLITTIVDPNEVINTYPKYRLTIPAKTTLSIAYVFDKKGLLSFDYRWSDLSALAFTTDSQGDYLGQLNTSIKSSFVSQQGLRIGGEYRTGRIQIQGGYSTSTDPQKSIQDPIKVLTAGLNYDLGGSVFGISMARQTKSSTRPLYGEGLSSTLLTEQNRMQFFLTYRMKL